MTSPAQPDDARTGPSEGLVEAAMDRWYEKYNGGTDRPHVSVWMPTGLPHARLQTVGHGCHEPDTLPSGPPIAYVTVGGVQIGGYLEDIELLFAATAECIVFIRAQYERMKADATRASSPAPSEAAPDA